MWYYSLGEYLPKQNMSVSHCVQTHCTRMSGAVSVSLTNSLEQSSCWEANRPSASQEIPRILGTQIFITAFTKARHLSLSWTRSIQSMLPSKFSNIYFNIGLPSRSRSSKWSLALRSLHHNPSCIPFVPHAPPISLVLIWLPKLYFDRCAEHKAFRFVVRKYNVNK